MLKLLRDTLIVYGLTFLSGFVVGAAAGPAGLDQPSMQIAIALANIVFGIVGFTIVGAMTKTQRFKYMTKVVFLLWAVNLMNLLMGGTLLRWFLGLPFLFAIMGVGGALSLLFAPTTKGQLEPTV
jgi:hypothetical protein